MNLPDVAALFVSRKGPYWGRPDVDAWDEDRDARKYDGPWPVVAHPPCAAWCQLAGLREHRYGLKQGDDGGCFASAIAAVRRFGGVVEHPAWSKAWKRFTLTTPNSKGGWKENSSGEWTCVVSQCAYGHRARKLTWLYYVGTNPPAPLDWSRPIPSAVVSGSHNHCSRPIWDRNRVWSKEASRTPEAFADALLSLARNCGGVPTK